MDCYQIYLSPRYFWEIFYFLGIDKPCQNFASCVAKQSLPPPSADVGFEKDALRSNSRTPHSHKNTHFRGYFVPSCGTEGNLPPLALTLFVLALIDYVGTYYKNIIVQFSLDKGR